MSKKTKTDQIMKALKIGYNWKCEEIKAKEYHPDEYPGDYEADVLEFIDSGLKEAGLTKKMRKEIAYRLIIPPHQRR